MSLPRFPARTLAALVSATMMTAALTGCGAMESITGAQGMQWVGDEDLPKDTVSVDEYRAVPSLPDLTAPEVTDIFGKKVPEGATDTEAAGKDWSVAVAQSDFATTVRYVDVCDDLTTDADAAIKAGEGALDALGLDPSDWAWFSLTDKNGKARAIAEPKIEGRQTWATGSLAVLVNEAGDVCAVNGILMKFERTGNKNDLDSAHKVFQEARHSEGLAVDGDYKKHEQTWTLNTEGILSPLWRFSTDDHAIVAVQLGDGLETTFDTESSLSDAIEKDAKEPEKSSGSDG